MAKLDMYPIEEWPELVRKADFRPEDLAALLRVSPRTLSRHINQRFGCSVEDWLDRERMAAAPDLLKRKRLIKAVAPLLGYNHPRTFSEKFRKHYGLRPAEFLASSDHEALFGRSAALPAPKMPEGDLGSRKRRKRA